MIIVVLFTLVLLAGILAASTRLGVSADQNVAENSRTLRAQYAAESGLSRATVRVKEIQTLLSANNTVVPTGLTAATLITYAQNYCGNSSWVTTTDTATGQAVSTCQVTQATTGGAQFNLLSDLVNPAAYAAVLPASEAAGAGTGQWWKSRLGQMVTVTGTDINYKFLIQPTRVERRGSADFRFYLKLGLVATKGVQGTAVRALKSQAVQNGEWWIGLSQPGFLDTVLFTNRHRSRGSATNNVGFNDQTFNGPVHTNEKFLFYSGSTASFKGQVTTAGCTNLATLAVSSTTCVQTPGAYLGNGTVLLAPAAGLVGSALNTDVQNKIAAQTSVNWNGYSPTFNAKYRPMPTTANSQQADASSQGLYFPAATAINSIVLKAGNASGTSPTVYDASTQKWSPVPTHQFITVTPASGPAIQYRYGSDRTLQQNVAGTWTNIKSNFNGVIFAEDSIGYTDTSVPPRKFGGMSGPGRNAGGQPLPALAPFAQMTVAGAKDMYISGDLAMSETPKVCDPAAAGFAACKADANLRTNVLGLYVQGSSATPADISMTWDTPNNVTLHAMTMTSTGEMNVQYHDQLKNSASRGTVNLIGGLVENFYGAFGTSGGSGGRTGFSRDFNYDRRFQDNPGFGPPSFPISPVWVAQDSSSVEQSNPSMTEAEKVRLTRSAWKQVSAADY